MSRNPASRTKGRLTAISSMQQQAYECHRTRVREATATVDMEPPRPRPHVFYNAKGLQLQRERQATITQDNFILLKNLREIMNGSARKTKNGLDKPKSKCIKTR